MPQHQHPHRRQQALDPRANGLQLSLGLRLLEDRLQLGGLHDVALDLHLAAHEHLLGIRLASDEVTEVLVGEDERDYVGRKSATGSSL